MRTTILLFVLLFSSYCLYSEPFLEEIPGPDGGAVYDLARDSSGNMYAATKFGVFISSDVGKNWEKVMNANIMNDCKLTTSGNSVVLSCIPIGIYAESYVHFISDDGFKTFDELIISRQFIHNISLDEYANIYAATDEGVKLSEDNGNTWKNIGLNLYNVKSLGYYNGTLYAVSDNFECFISTVPWDIWEVIQLDSIGFIGLTEISDDQIINIGEGIFINTEFPNSLWHIFTNENETCLLSSILNTDNSIYYVNGKGELLYYNKKIQSWEDHNLSKWLLSGFLKYDEDNIFASNLHEGILKLIKDDESWIKSNSGFNLLFGEKIFTGDKSTLFFYKESYGLFRTINFGHSWDKCIIDFSTITSHLYHNGVLYVSTDVGLFISTNNGIEWELKSNQNEFSFMDFTSNGLMIAKSGPYLYKSSDAIKFEKIKTFLKRTLIRINSADNIFAFMDYAGILMSDDLGETWVTINTDENYYLNIIINSKDEIVILDSLDIFKSKDNGKTFEIGDIKRMYRVLMDFDSLDHVFLINKDSDKMFDLEILSSDLQRLNLVHISEPYSIAADGNGYFYISTYSGLFKTKNPTDINEQEVTKHSISIWPNPVRDHITLSFSSGSPGYIEVSIIDLPGREYSLLPGTYSNAASLEQRFDISAFSAGVYFIKVKIGTDTFLKKLMITNK